MWKCIGRTCKKFNQTYIKIIHVAKSNKQPPKKKYCTADENTQQGNKKYNSSWKNWPVGEFYYRNFDQNGPPYNYLKWKSQRNRSVWLSETLAWISTGVGNYFACYQKLPLKFLNWVGNKNHSMNFVYTWPSIRLIHI